MQIVGIYELRARGDGPIGGYIGGLIYGDQYSVSGFSCFEGIAYLYCDECILLVVV